jgi:hypothetical protein
MKNSNFNRRFNYQITSQGYTKTVKNLTVERLIKKKPQGADFEYIYALDFYGLDKILDLKQGESAYIKPNRDNSDSKGILTRTI